MAELPHRQQLFVQEFLKDLNYRQAALRAGYSDGHHRLLTVPEVQEAIAAAFSERSKRVQIDADEVLRELHSIATADVNELIEFRRTCCRYCWGINFNYQYTTQRMLKRAEAQFNRTIEALVDEFEHGGIGFDPKREPNHECPECFGEGIGEVYAKDTRMLSPRARSLYAGAKRTKDGIEIKTHEKGKALELLARHLGLLNDKLEVTGELALATRIVQSRKRVGSS